MAGHHPLSLQWSKIFVWQLTRNQDCLRSNESWAMPFRTSMSISQHFALRKERPSSDWLPPGIQPTQAVPALSGFALFGHAAEGELSFCDRTPGSTPLVPAPGSMVLCPPELAPQLRERFPTVHVLEHGDARAAFIDLAHRLLAEDAVQVGSDVPRPFGIDPTAHIASCAVIHPEVRIERGARIGNHCVIHRGCWIGMDAVIRDNAVIGVDGINAYRGIDGKMRKFPHFAGVRIGAECEIGANVVIARGILTDTTIGNGSTIGNLCNIGHGTMIGAGVWISVGTLVGGHTTIGDEATLGLGVAVRDNLFIGAGTHVGMGSVVVRGTSPGTSVFGNPARPVPRLSAGPQR